MFGCFLLEVYSFLMRNGQERSESRGSGVREEVGAAEGGETIPRIHCMRKGPIFNKRKKQKGGAEVKNML